MIYWRNYGSFLLRTELPALLSFGLPWLNGRYRVGLLNANDMCRRFTQRQRQRVPLYSPLIQSILTAAAPPTLPHFLEKPCYTQMSLDLEFNVPRAKGPWR